MKVEEAEKIRIAIGEGLLEGALSILKAVEEKLTGKTNDPGKNPNRTKENAVEIGLYGP